MLLKKSAQREWIPAGSPGEQHDVLALTDAVIFVSSQKATPFVEG